MLVCPNCHGLCQSGSACCPNCKNRKLRPVTADDLVLLQRADEYAAHRLAERLEAAGISCRSEPAATGLRTPLFDGGAMPTDKIVLVRYGDLEAAQQISREVLDELSKERQPDEQPEGEFEDMPLKKRLVVQTVSIILFMALVAVAVLGADAVANWLKSLFGIG